MKIKIYAKLLFLLGFAFFLIFSGCTGYGTLAGLCVGVISDESRPDSLLIEGLACKDLKPGSRINLILNNGDLINGKFGGLVEASNHEYFERYQLFEEHIPDSIRLPMPGDSITLINARGREWRYQFLGFDYQLYLSLRNSDSEDPVKIKLSQIYEKIRDQNGNIIEAETLRNLMSENKVPMLSSIIMMHSRNGNIPISMENVYQIYLMPKNHGVAIGLLIGVILDVLILDIRMSQWD